MISWTLPQVLIVLLLALGGVVSQTPLTERCKSPIAKGGIIFFRDIPESLPVGSTVGSLQLQGSPDEIRLSCLSSPCDPFVTFDPVSQNLTVTSPLDYESRSTLDIRVECEILEGGFKLNYEVKISTVDVNDNPPRFVDAPYGANISELMPVGSTVLTGISATDADADNWKITFEIEEGPYSDHFAFPRETSGNLMLVKSLDYEAVQSIELRLVAKDNHPDVLSVPQPQLNTTATATIRLYDGDDQNPAFSTPSYLAYVLENSPLNTPIEISPELQAEDLDRGLNTEVSYSFVPDTIHSPPYSSYFHIDSVTGHVTLKNDVLRRGEQFCLLVQATQVDDANRYSMTSLFIVVQAANENQPRFLQGEYVTELVENVPIGAVVTTVEALDNDVGSVLEYSFTNPLLVTDFAIDNQSGVITTKRELLYERQASYNLSVAVSDGKWSDTSSVLVRLININNHNPTFERRIYNFEGHKEDNFYLGQVTALDLDIGSVVSYTLADNISLYSLSSEGELYFVGDVASVADEETHTLCVTAEDDGVPPRRDVSVVRVRYGAGATPGGVTVAGQQTDLVVIIILGVLSGCLLLIIAVLSIYIYRNSVHPAASSPTPSQQYSNGDDPIDAYFESSKSFERDLPTYSNGFMDPIDGLYKQQHTPAHGSHSNSIYSNVEPHGTTIQENPFQLDNDSDPSNSSYYNSRQSVGRGSVGGRYPLPPAPSTSSSMAHHGNGSGSLSTMGRGAAEMHSVQEIDYHTALEPMDNVTSAHSGPRHRSRDPMGSDQSLDGGLVASLSTFKMANSTQALVPLHGDSPGTSPRGAKGSSVSFIEENQVNVYHPDNPTIREKPEITVYY